MATTPVVHTEKLTKRFGESVAIESLDLDIHKGEVFGYLGPNGAGKTTTIRLLLGLIKPSEGSAQLFGLDSEKDKEAIHRRIAYVPGEANLWPGLTGEETIHLLGKVHGTVDEGYRDTLVKRFDFDPSKKVRAYSKGNRQKLNLISGLMTRTDLLILDEPTSGLDPLMEQVFQECVHEAKANGQTVFLSSHILSEVEALCDQVGILRAGKLVETGTLAQIRHLSAVTIEATFKNTPPDISGVKGVSNVKITGQHLYCQVQGPMEEVIAHLSKAAPVKLLSREPSLDELFLTIYGSGHDGQ
ncbi:MAG: ABC transporter ATP-binding protein [bacterium]